MQKGIPQESRVQAQVYQRNLERTVATQRRPAVDNLPNSVDKPYVSVDNLWKNGDNPWINWEENGENFGNPVNYLWRKCVQQEKHD
jgi:hypothetical protein